MKMSRTLALALALLIAAAGFPAQGAHAEKNRTEDELSLEEDFQVFYIDENGVAVESVKLVSIENPPDITNVPNGAGKTKKELKLPDTVTIGTTSGKRDAKVSWDVEGCLYDPKSVSAQTVSIKGEVTLPEDVENPLDFSLITSIKVLVEGRAPAVPNASGNKITGISSEEPYTIESKICFTAEGTGMENEEPGDEDMRYVPANWYVKQDSMRSFDAAPYKATFRMAAGGDYELTVLFDQQVYKGGVWKKTGLQDVKTTAFRVMEPEVPAPEETEALPQSRKTVHKSGDTGILPYIAGGIAAALVVFFFLVFLVIKKRKM